MIDYDFYVWVQGAKTLTREGLSAAGKVYKEPLLSILLNLVAPVFGGDYEVAGKAIALLSGSVAIGLLFRLACDLQGSRGLALLTALVTAAHPQVITYSTYPFSETPYLALILAAVYWFWRMEQGGSIGAAFASGLALGLAFLTRIPGIATALALFAVGILTMAVERPWEASRARRWAVLLLGFLLLAGPYWVSIRYHSGQWQLSNKVASNVLIREAYSVHDPAQKVENYERMLYSPDKPSRVAAAGGLFTSLLKDPVPALAAYGHQFRLGLELAHWVFPLPLVALGLLAVGVLWRRDQVARRRGVIYLALLAPFFAYPLGHVEQRYMFPLIPVFMLLTVEGVQWVASFSPRLGWPGRGLATVRRASVALALVAAGLTVGWSARELAAYPYRSPWSEPIELKQAGLWLKAHTPPGAIVMARKPMVAFYADRPWVPLPYTDYEGLLQSLKSQQVSFLVMDQLFAGRLRPQLRFLLYDPEAIRRLVALTPVHAMNERPGRGFITYRVN